jgi:hypothetical protein
MICRIQVVPLGEDSQQETREDRIPAAHRFEAGDAGPDFGRGKNDPERPSSDPCRRSSGQLSIAKAALS